MSLFRALREREAAALPEAWIAARAERSDDLVQRLKLQHVLTGHEGCVNTVSFDPTGETLVSGSDDQKIILHDWQAGTHRLTFDSGHSQNVFQARFIPQTGNKTIVSCAADGQVRLSYLRPDGRVELKRISRHRGRAHKLALQPDCPARFLSCGEDGQVKAYDLRWSDQSALTHMAVTNTQRFTAAASVHSITTLNSVVVNPARPWLFAVAGGDVYTHIYDARRLGTYSAPASEHARPNKAHEVKGNPVALLAPSHLVSADHASHHITCVAYNHWGELLASYNDQDIYLFDEAAACGHERSSGIPPASAPRPASGSESANASSCPAEPSEGSIRTSPSRGGSRGVLPGPDHVLQRYSGHENSRTVKGVAFLGERGEHVVSGSDCGHVYIWRKSDAALLTVRKGDDNIVNCLEPHPWLPATLATSGIDNDIKIWAPIAETATWPDMAAQQLMERNRSRRTRREQVVLTPAAIAALLQRAGAQARRVSRRREGPAATAGEQQRGGDAAASDGQGDEENEGADLGVLSALQLVETLGGGLEDVAGEDEEDDEDSDGDEGGSTPAGRRARQHPPRCYVT